MVLIMRWKDSGGLSDNCTSSPPMPNLFLLSSNPMKSMRMTKAKYEVYKHMFLWPEQRNSFSHQSALEQSNQSSWNTEYKFYERNWWEILVGQQPILILNKNPAAKCMCWYILFEVGFHQSAGIYDWQLLCYVLDIPTLLSAQPLTFVRLTSSYKAH